MRIVPVPNSVIVEPVQQAEKTGGGVFIPDDKRKLLDEGIIREVGSNVTSHFAVGDRIVYSRYSGSWVKLHKDGAGALGDGENLLVLDARDGEGDVLAKLVA